MRVLLAGCGDLGTRLGLKLVRGGHEVIGLRRHPEGLPAAFEPLAADLTHPGDLRIRDIDAVVITLTPDEYTDEGYDRTYRRGVEGLIGAVDPSLERVVLLSSTRVLGRGSPGEFADEDLVPQPDSAPAHTLWETENLIRSAFASAAIVRAAGIYGRENSRLIAGVRSGRAVNYRRWTNRIHHADLIRALEALVLGSEVPRLLHAVDSCPAQLGEVVEFLASRLNVTPPPDLSDETEVGRRLENTRFREFIGSLEFPTFREGMTQQLRTDMSTDEEGTADSR